MKRRRQRILKLKRNRMERIVLRVLRGTFRPASWVLPRSFSAALAELLFRTPPRQKRLRRERDILAAARFRQVRAGAARLATWQWGEGPAVLLVHGWGGHAGRLAPFVRPLVEEGFSVISFDAPGHGDSSGARSSLPEFVQATRAVVKAYGGVVGLVGHSIGAAACALALRDGVRAERVVLIAPAVDPEQYSGRFASLFGIPASVRRAMVRRFERRYNICWDALCISRDVPGEAAPALVFHDRRDSKVPLRDGKAIANAWPGAQLIVTRGLGHHRILRDPDVVRCAVGFLRGRRPVVAEKPAAAAPFHGKAIALKVS